MQKTFTNTKHAFSLQVSKKDQFYNLYIVDDTDKWGETGAEARYNITVMLVGSGESSLFEKSSTFRINSGPSGVSLNSNKNLEIQ